MRPYNRGVVLLPPSLTAHAEAQFGLVTRAQATEELPVRTLYRRVASGLLIPVGRGVYRLVGAPPTWRQRAMARCLVIGGEVVISHLAAAYLWQAVDIAPPPVQVTVPPGRRPQRGQPAPRRLPLPARDRTRRWGIPVTTPARTVLDLSTTLTQPLLERVVDDLIRSRRLRIEDVVERLDIGDPLPRLRRDVLHEVLTPRVERGSGASPREDWVVDALLGGGLPLPVRNLVVEVGDDFLELDCAYPDERIAIEYDGIAIHGDLRHFHSDRHKATVLQLAGWIVLQVTSDWTAEILVQRVTAAFSRHGRGPPIVLIRPR